jgi:hypothetical protein
MNKEINEIKERASGFGNIAEGNIMQPLTGSISTLWGKCLGGDSQAFNVKSDIITNSDARQVQHAFRFSPKLKKAFMQDVEKGKKGDFVYNSNNTQQTYLNAIIGTPDNNLVTNDSGMAGAVSPYQQYLGGVLKPLQVSLGKKHTADIQSLVLTSEDATIEDFVTHSSGAYSSVIPGLSEGFKFQLDFSGGSTYNEQDTTSPNPMQQSGSSSMVNFNAQNRITVPYIARNRVRTQNEFARTLQINSNAMFGGDIATAYQEALAIDDKICEEKKNTTIITGKQVDGSRSRMASHCLMVQDTDGAPNMDAFGLTNSKKPLQTMSEADFIEFLLKIKLFIQKRQMHTQGAVLFNKFMMPSVEFMEMNSQMVYKPYEALQNGGFGSAFTTIGNIKASRAALLVAFLKYLGIDTLTYVHANPTSVVIYGADGESALPNFKNLNPLGDKPFYMLYRDNSGSITDDLILYQRPTMYLDTGFVPSDFFNLSTTSVQMEFASMIKFMRPQLSRFVFTTPA